MGSPEKGFPHLSTTFSSTTRTGRNNSSYSFWKHSTFKNIVKSYLLEWRTWTMCVWKSEDSSLLPPSGARTLTFGHQAQQQVLLASMLSHWPKAQHFVKCFSYTIFLIPTVILIKQPSWVPFQQWWNQSQVTQRKLAAVMPLICWDLSLRLVCLNKEDLAFY